MAATDVPPYHELLWPTLQAVAELGGSASIGEIVETVIKRQGFSDAQELLLDQLMDMPPDAFERLAQRLLREADFDSVNVTGKSGRLVEFDAVPRLPVRIGGQGGYQDVTPADGHRNVRGRRIDDCAAAITRVTRGGIMRRLIRP